MVKNDAYKLNYKTDFTEKSIKLEVSDNNQFTKLPNIHKPNFPHYHFKTFGGGGIL